MKKLNAVKRNRAKRQFRTLMRRKIIDVIREAPTMTEIFKIVKIHENT